MDTFSWIWLISGMILLVSEMVIPGAVVAFLGTAAILVALGRWTGLIDGVMDSFMYWFMISMGLVLAFRGLVVKAFPSESHIEYDDDDLDAFGEIVEVVEEISHHHEKGRIRLQGTTWAATTGTGTIAPGEKVRLIQREDLVWLVEPCSPEELTMRKK